MINLLGLETWCLLVFIVVSLSRDSAFTVLFPSLGVCYVTVFISSFLYINEESVILYLKNRLMDEIN